MPVYQYKGVDSRGKKLSGTVDGDGLKAVKAKLKKEGVVVLEISEASSARAARRGEFTFGRARVRTRDLANATRQLATLLASGLTLMDALVVLVEQEESAALKQALSSARDAVREGSSLADALRKNPKAFSTLYVNMVSAGEASGTLEITLSRLADFLDERVQFQGKLAAALAYPALMTFVGVGVLIFVFTYVMPKILWIFEDSKEQLPVITTLLLGLVNFFSSFWWLVLGVFAGAIYGLRRYLSTPEGKAVLDARMLRVPVFGSLIRMITVSRFTRTLGTLLQGGVPALGALDIVKNITGNTVIANAIQRARESVREGESLADPLRRSGLFPPVVVQMVAVGEKSGELEKMLLKVSDAFDKTVENRITALMSLLTPVIILIMAVVVGFVVMAILLPILQMSTAVR